MAFSAADYNKVRHCALLFPARSNLGREQRLMALEGAPDPFPTRDEDFSVKTRDGQRVLDTDSQSDFPALSSAPLKHTRDADSGPRIKASIRSQPMVSHSFTQSSIALPTTKDGRPLSLGEVMKRVMSKFKVKIEASANQKARQTTFHMKSDSENELEKAKRHLLSLLSPMVGHFQIIVGFAQLVLGYPDFARSLFYHRFYRRS